jgi:hypothetical protein
MTSDEISQQIRDGSLSEIASDIPTGLTLAEYAAARRGKSGPSLKARVVSIFLPRKSR